MVVQRHWKQMWFHLTFTDGKDFQSCKLGLEKHQYEGRKLTVHVYQLSSSL